MFSLSVSTKKELTPWSDQNWKNFNIFCTGKGIYCLNSTKNLVVTFSQPKITNFKKKFTKSHAPMNRVICLTCNGFFISYRWGGGEQNNRWSEKCIIFYVSRNVTLKFSELKKSEKSLWIYSSSALTFICFRREE